MVLEAPGGGPETISVPGGDPRDADAGAEKVMKSSSILRCFLVFWAPQNHTFSVFFDFCVVFRGMFFGSGFWRPPGIIFKGFGGGFRSVFSCFFEHVGQGSVLRKTSFCIVFYIVSGTSTFSKQVRN